MKLVIDNSFLGEELSVVNYPFLGSIDCRGKQITKLTIINCPRLKEVWAYHNRLTEIIIENCPQINRFSVDDNFLTTTAWLNNLPTELKGLHIASNDFPPQNLSVFGRFVNLDTLHINDNLFFGNCQVLTHITNLKYLGIANNNVVGKVEYLPTNLQTICCTGTLSEQLADYRHSGRRSSRNNYDYQAWKQTHPQLIKYSYVIMQLEIILSSLNFTLTNSHPQNAIILQGLNIFIFETESKINQLKQEIEEIKHQELATKIEISPK